MALLAAVVVDHFHIIGVTVDEAKDDTQLAGHRNGGEASPVSGEAVDSIAAPAEVLGGRRGLDEGQDATDLVGVLGGQPPAIPASQTPSDGRRRRRNGNGTPGWPCRADCSVG